MGKAKRKPKTTTASQRAASSYPGVDFGPGIVLDRGDRIIEHPTSREGVRRARAVSECRLDWYHHRALIDDRQYEAGLKFRSMCRLAMLQPRTTSLYGGVPGAGHDGGQRLDGLRAVRNATEDMPAKQRDVLIAVCAEDEWASGEIALFREGLTKLADYWRIGRK